LPSNIVTSSSCLTPSSIVVANPEQVSSALAGESVILSLRSGTYYGLNEVGSCIWKWVQHPITIINLCNAIMAEFDVDPQTCETEVIRLISELIEVSLVEVHCEMM
jgi:Coenzyme PQQ synthesis protein D (PqqD)